MINISTLFDPRYMFLVIAPILFAFNKNVGHRAIIALALTEWINQILKWLLAGDRPYWYVHERANELANRTISMQTSNAIFISQPIPSLKQFHVTCELGAGSPSGHAMVTATVLYIVIEAYLKGELGPNPAALKQWVTRVTWSLYLVALVAVSLSRVYLACHFPHQCLGGAVCGLLVARFVSEKVPLGSLKRHHFAMATGFMFASVMSVYAILTTMGFDPLWSVNKGTRWCIKKEYIHMDTTPFFSMMRYLGFALGPGLAYSYSIQTSTLKTNNCRRGTKLDADQSQSLNSLSLASRTLAAIISILFGQLLMSVPVPRSNLILFYMISFLTYTLFSFAIASLIPRFARHLLGLNGDSRLKQY